MESTVNVKKTGYLVKLSWPIFIELLLQMLVGNVDQFMVGKHSPLSVGAIGNANQVINVLILTFSVISVATTILVSLYIGSNDRKKAEEIYTLSLFVNVVLGIAVSIILLFFNRQIFALMRVPEELMEESRLYMAIIGGGIAFQAVYLTFTAIFRSNAMMKETMLISVVINVINIIGNYILINGSRALNIPALGIAGAAISSDISRVLGVLLIFRQFQKRIRTKLSLSHLRPFPAVQFKKLMGIGIPSGGETLSYNSSLVCTQALVNRFGTTVITTRVYATMFAMISYLYSNAISQASQIVVGYLIGAQDIEGTKLQVKRTVFLSLIASFSLSVVLFLISDRIFGFFTSNEEVIELGRKIMAIDIVLELGRAVNMTMVRDLQACGDIRFPIVTGIISQWTVAVLGGFLLGTVFHLGLCGYWIAMTLDECIRAVLFLVRWRSGVWHEKSLIQAS